MNIISRSIKVENVKSFFEEWCKIVVFYNEDKTFDDPVLHHLEMEYEKLYDEKKWLESDADDVYFSLNEQKLLACFYEDVHTLIENNKEYISEEEYNQVQNEVSTAEKSFTKETKKEHRKRIIKLNALLSKFSYAIGQALANKTLEISINKIFELGNQIIEHHLNSVF